jgi:hypothetical protein
VVACATGVRETGEKKEAARDGVDEAAGDLDAAAFFAT